MFFILIHDKVNYCPMPKSCVLLKITALDVLILAKKASLQQKVKAAVYFENQPILLSCKV